jgi:hypothetical protein
MAIAAGDWSAKPFPVEDVAAVLSVAMEDFEDLEKTLVSRLNALVAGDVMQIARSETALASTWSEDELPLAAGVDRNQAERIKEIAAAVVERVRSTRAASSGASESQQ